jgi:flagellar biosynthesis chaperone FliJ
MKTKNTIPQAEEQKAPATTAETEVKEVKLQPLPPEVQELITRLKQENASLQIKLQEQPLSLEEKIKFFQEKKAKIDKLGKLDAYAEGLLKIGQEAQEASEADEFFSEKYSVRVSRKTNSYREEFEDVLKIQNPVLVVEVLGYALERINSKRSQLKAEIEA